MENINDLEKIKGDIESFNNAAPNLLKQMFKGDADREKAIRHTDIEQQILDEQLERIATAAMVGMLHNGGMTEVGVRVFAPTDIAALAVNQAKALINELNKQQ